MSLNLLKMLIDSSAFPTTLSNGFFSVLVASVASAPTISRFLHMVTFLVADVAYTSLFADYECHICCK